MLIPKSLVLTIISANPLSFLACYVPRLYSVGSLLSSRRMQHTYTVRGINPPHDQSFVTPVGACKLLDGHPPRSYPPRRTLGLSPISASRFALEPPKRLQRVWFNMCVLGQLPLRALLARSQHIHRIVSQFPLTKLIFGGVVGAVAHTFGILSFDGLSPFRREGDFSPDEPGSGS